MLKTLSLNLLLILWVVLLTSCGRGISYYKSHPSTLVYWGRNASCGAALGGLASGELRLRDGKAIWRSSDDGGNFQGSIHFERAGTYEIEGDILRLRLDSGTWKKINLISQQVFESGIQPAETVDLKYVEKYEGFFLKEDLGFLSDKQFIWDKANYQLNGPDCHAVGYYHMPPVPLKNYLSRDWALFMRQWPGGSTILSQAEAQQELKEALASYQRALALSRAQKTDESIDEFERSLDHAANADAYYEYGNALSGKHRFADAAAAYEIASALGFTKPELVLYNTACAYSQAGQTDKALEFLVRALDSGYDAFDWIGQDPDLASLRALPSWPRIATALLPARLSTNEPALVSIITEADSNQIYRHLLFCSSGIAWEFDYGNDAATRYRWKLADGQVVGAKEHLYVFHHDSNWGPPLGEYERELNLGSDRGKDYTLFPRGAVRNLLIQSALNQPFRESNFAAQKFSSVPKICDPEFTPKQTSDFVFEYREIKRPKTAHN